MKKIDTISTGIIAAILASFCWATATILSKFALGHVSPVALLALQLLASVMALWLVILCRAFRHSVTLPSFKEIAPIAVLGLLEPGLAYLLGLIGLTDMSAGGATLIQASEALMIIGASTFLLKERPGFLLVILSLLALAGLFIALGARDAAEVGNGFFGMAMMFFATASAAIYVVLSSRFATRYDPITIVAAQQSIGLLGSLFLLPFEAHYSASGIVLPNTFFIGFIVVVSGIVQYALAFSLYMKALSSIRANIAGSFLNLTPVFGLILAFLALGERLTFLQLGGAIAVILAVTLITITNRSHA